jgi:hypothetical protein
VRPVWLLACVAALALLASGCAGGGESTDEWAESFCSATFEWGESLTQIGDGITGGSVATEDLQGAVAGAREATDTYVADLESLGAPDAGSGDEIEAALDELATEVEGEVEEIEDALDDMSGVAAAATTEREIRASLAAMLTALDRALTALDEADPDGELTAAFDAAESCDRIA